MMIFLLLLVTPKASVVNIDNKERKYKDPNSLLKYQDERNEILFVDSMIHQKKVNKNAIYFIICYLKINIVKTESKKENFKRIHLSYLGR